MEKLAKIAIAAYHTEVSQAVMPLEGYPVQKWLILWSPDCSGHFGRVPRMIVIYAAVIMLSFYKQTSVNIQNILFVAP